MITLTEGQLSDTVGNLYTNYGLGYSNDLGIACRNWGNTNVNVVIQHLRVKNNSVKTLTSVPLGPGDTYVLDGFQIGGSGDGNGRLPGDSVQGSASVANAVDYAVFYTGNQHPNTIRSYDANGALKVHPNYTLCCK